LTGDASVIRFDEVAGQWQPTPMANYRLTEHVRIFGRTWTITAPEGLRYNFAADGTLSEIRDLNNNLMTFKWAPVKRSPVPRLVEVTDSLSRTIVFRYGPEGYLKSVEVPALKLK